MLSNGLLFAHERFLTGIGWFVTR